MSIWQYMFVCNVFRCGYTFSLQTFRALLSPNLFCPSCEYLYNKMSVPQVLNRCIQFCYQNVCFKFTGPWSLYSSWFLRTWKFLATRQKNIVQYIRQMDDSKKVLLVDGDDIDKKLKLATQNLHYVNVLPSIGLNVYSILQHDTLVMTRAAINRIVERMHTPINR